MLWYEGGGGVVLKSVNVSLCVVLFRMSLCCCIMSCLSSSPCGQSRCRGATGHCPGSPARTTTATFFPTSIITPTTLTSPTARPSRNLLQTTLVMPLSFLLNPSCLYFLSSSPLLLHCLSLGHIILHGLSRVTLSNNFNTHGVKRHSSRLFSITATPGSFILVEFCFLIGQKDQ